MSDAVWDADGEKALIQRIRDGEPELFYELVRPHERSVYLAALAILRNESDAEEIAQEAVFKAFTHLDGFRAESRFGTWLIQITINEARMRRRKDHSDIMMPLETRPGPAGEETDYTPVDFADWREIPSETLERRELREALARALASLPDIYREVFILRDVRNLATAETSELLGISEGAVKTRLLRARLQMREALAPGLGGNWSSPAPFGKGKKPWS
ncbi:MAG TPA: sigma-70 family RNA polymerase sigma factor [Terriglobia bacterium]|nr:sigma-70 family RNA polymerase sigma factor [Terriglobia bacterium]